MKNHIVLILSISVLLGIFSSLVLAQEEGIDTPPETRDGYLVVMPTEQDDADNPVMDPFIIYFPEIKPANPFALVLPYDADVALVASESNPGQISVIEIEPHVPSGGYWVDSGRTVGETTDDIDELADPFEDNTENNQLYDQLLDLIGADSDFKATDSLPFEGNDEAVFIGLATDTIEPDQNRGNVRTACSSSAVRGVTVFSFDRGVNVRPLTFQLLQMGAEPLSFGIPTLHLNNDGAGVIFSAVSNASGAADSLNNRLVVRTYQSDTIQQEELWAALLGFEEWNRIDELEIQSLVDVLGDARASIFPRSGLAEGSLPANGVIQIEMIDHPNCRQPDASASADLQMGMDVTWYQLDDDECPATRPDRDEFALRDLEVDYPIELTDVDDSYVYHEATLARGSENETQAIVCAGSWNFFLGVPPLDNTDEEFLSCIREWETRRPELEPNADDAVSEVDATSVAELPEADAELLTCLVAITDS